jgi:hypothetical protein
VADSEKGMDIRLLIAYSIELRESVFLGRVRRRSHLDQRYFVGHEVGRPLPIGWEETALSVPIAGVHPHKELGTEWILCLNSDDY